MILLQLLPLIVFSGNAGTLAVPDQVQEVLNSDHKGEVNPAGLLYISSVPSSSQGEGPGGTVPLVLSQPLPATVSSGSADALCVPDCVQQPAKPSAHPLGPGTTSEDTSNQKSTSTTAKSILHGVEESSDAYPPLKSVARCLCIILASCEV
jgi:hypothetical protein